MGLGVLGCRGTRTAGLLIVYVAVDWALCFLLVGSMVALPLWFQHCSTQQFKCVVAFIMAARPVLVLLLLSIVSQSPFSSHCWSLSGCNNSIASISTQRVPHIDRPHCATVMCTIHTSHFVYCALAVKGLERKTCTIAGWHFSHYIPVLAD